MSSVLLKADLKKFLRDLIGEETAGPSLKTTPEKPKATKWKCPRCGWVGFAKIDMQYKAGSKTGSLEHAGRKFGVCGGPEECGMSYITDPLPAEDITKYAIFYNKKLWAVADKAANCATCGDDKKPVNRKRSLEDSDSSPAKRAKVTPKKATTSSVKAEPVAGPSKPKHVPKARVKISSSSSPPVIVISDSEDDSRRKSRAKPRAKRLAKPRQTAGPDFFTDREMSVEA